MIFVIVALVFLIRLIFFKISIRNEKKILADGGREYGVENSKYITILHILFYTFCFIEAFVRKVHFDVISLIGLCLIIFSMCMLYVATRLLKDIWAVKLMLLADHKYVDHWLFKTVKHPNYFLNIIPELIGLTLLCHAYFTAIILFSLYSFVLYRRIKEEETLLNDVIIKNGIR